MSNHHTLAATKQVLSISTDIKATQDIVTTLDEVFASAYKTIPKGRPAGWAKLFAVAVMLSLVVLAKIEITDAQRKAEAAHIEAMAKAEKSRDLVSSLLREVQKDKYTILVPYQALACFQDAQCRKHAADEDDDGLLPKATLKLAKTAAIENINYTTADCYIAVESIKKLVSEDYPKTSKAFIKEYEASCHTLSTKR